MKKLVFVLSFIIFLAGVLNTQTTGSIFVDTEKSTDNVLSVATDWGITPTPTPEPTPPVTPIVINEVEYDTHQSGTDSDWEWFELYNNTSSPITLIGWTISDNISSDVIPELTLPANGFAVVAATSDFNTNYPSFSGLIVYIPDGVIGNGLANDDDRLILKNAGGKEIDAVSWGKDDYAFGVGNGVRPATGAGHSIARKTNGLDTNSPDDWQKLINPTPGS